APAVRVRPAVPRDACCLDGRSTPAVGKSACKRRAKGEAAMTELAHRASNGIDVALLWNRRNGRLVVAVADVRPRGAFTLDAPQDRALDVFNPPFAYATARVA